MTQFEKLDMEAVFEGGVGKQDENYQELIDILDNVNCEKMLVNCFFAGRIKNVQPSDNPMTARLELLAEHCVGRFGNQEPTFQIDEKIESCMGVLDTILMLRSFATLSKEGIDSAIPEISRIAAMNHANVRGTAYFSQLENRILSIQASLDNWYQKKLGLTATRFFEIVNQIVEETTANFEKLRVAAIQIPPERIDFTKFSDLVFEHTPVDLTQFVSAKELPYFADLLFFSKKVQDAGKTARNYPIIALPDGRVIMSEGTHALDCLWWHLDEAVKGDRRTYDGRYQKTKAKWLEKVAIEYLKRIFPASDVYETLDYKLMGKEKGKDTAELDAAVKWGDFVLLIEAKAKDYSLLAQQGDFTKLRNALKKNVEDAFHQSIRAENEIRSNQSVTFTERATKRELVLRSDDVHNIYPISLSLHHLVGISTRLHQAKELGLFKSGSFPLTICAADLDSITKCDIEPEVLLHYVEQRLDIMNGREEEWLGDEHDLFSAYLDTRLIRKNIEERSGTSDFNMLSFSGYSDMFDQLEIHERGGIPDRPDTSIRLPNNIKKLIKALCARGTDNSRAVAFFLLGLEDGQLNSMDQAIEEVGTNDFPIAQNRSVICATEDSVITLLFLSSATPEDQVKKKTVMRCSLEKYRRKLNKGIAIAIKPAKVDRGYECAVIEVSEWKEDPELEKLAVEFAPTPRQGTKLPKRNEKCFCGSGKKFKKCCLRRVEEERRKKN